MPVAGVEALRDHMLAFMHTASGSKTGAAQ